MENESNFLKKTKHALKLTNRVGVAAFMFALFLRSNVGSSAISLENKQINKDYLQRMVNILNTDIFTRGNIQTSTFSLYYNQINQAETMLNDLYSLSPSELRSISYNLELIRYNLTELEQFTQEELSLLTTEELSSLNQNFANLEASFKQLNLIILEELQVAYLDISSKDYAVTIILLITTTSLLISRIITVAQKRAEKLKRKNNSLDESIQIPRSKLIDLDNDGEIISSEYKYEIGNSNLKES